MTRTLGVALAILAAGYLAAGCVSGGVKSALPSVSASGSISFSPPTVTLPTVSPPTVSPPTLPPRTRSPSHSAAPPSETASAETPTLPPAPQSSRPSAAPTSAASPTETTPAVAPAPAPSPSTESPAPSPEPSSPAAAEASPSPAASESGSSLLWLWILLGVAVIAGVAVWLARRSGKRSALAASWRSKVVDASAKGLALKDMMTTAEAPAALAAEDASARWADIQRRADDLAETLYELRETAPGEAERARVAGVLASLQAVRSAMAAERAPGGAGAQQSARVHDLLLAFEASLRTRDEHGGSI